MRKIISLFYILLCIQGFSNDGMVSGEASHIVPLVENLIYIDKEILRIEYKNDKFYVNVYFEFYNPGAPVEFSVAFFSPPFHSMGESLEKISPIKDFTVLMNDKLLEYDLSQLNENIQLSHWKFNNDFLYTFKAIFNKGKNIIQHSYNLYGGDDSLGFRSLRYRLKTIDLWANKKVNHFQLQIKVPGIFKLFGITDDFQITGEGKGIDNEFNLKEDSALIYNITDFVPDADLSIQTNKWGFDYYLATRGGQKLSKSFKDLGYFAYLGYYNELVKNPEEFLKTLNKEELRFLRNAFFAWHNYQFKDKKLLAEFNKFIWYLPDPTVKANEIKLDDNQMKLLNRIQELEK